METDKGLYQKYQVIKMSNPEKKLDCIVLEFDDQNSWEAIEQFAITVKRGGYFMLYDDIMDKLKVARKALEGGK